MLLVLRYMLIDSKLIKFYDALAIFIWFWFYILFEELILRLYATLLWKTLEHREFLDIPVLLNIFYFESSIYFSLKSLSLSFTHTLKLKPTCVQALILRDY